jgi:hypothetical protein
LTFNGLHGVISQKMALFITTAVETSNPTFSNDLLGLHIVLSYIATSLLIIYVMFLYLDVTPTGLV